MVKTRAWKANRDLPVESDKCRICRQAKETVMHWLSGSTKLAATEYLKRQNNSLMMLCVGLEIQEGLLGKITKWYKKMKNKGTVRISPTLNNINKTNRCDHRVYKQKYTK